MIKTLWHPLCIICRIQACMHVCSGPNFHSYRSISVKILSMMKHCSWKLLCTKGSGDSRGTRWTWVNVRVPLQQRRLSVSWAGLARVQLAHQKKLLFFSIQYFLKSMPEIPCSSLLSAVRDEQWHITSPVRTTKLVRGLGACDIWGEAERTVVLKL